MSAVKVCGKCREGKPLEDFHRMKRSKDGRQAECKDCQREGLRTRREAQPDAFRARQYRRLYGLTLEEVADAKEAQDSRCAICQRHEEATDHVLYVDHDHATGDFRGLLCRDCNTGLGMLRDDPALLATAILYLDRYEASKP